MTTFLRDEGLDPRCPVIDRAQLGDGARFYDWLDQKWKRFPKHTRVRVPMTFTDRATVLAFAKVLASEFTGGIVIVYETEPRESYTFADVLAAYYAMKEGKPAPERVQPDHVYLGLVYTRIAEWREHLKPMEPAA